MDEQVGTSARGSARGAGRVREGDPLPPDAGMATAEYAMATLAACGFAGLLIAVLSSDEVRGMLVRIVQQALSLA
ncbi:DUF4244 domain-containing protein [Kineococcus vitellinus]|uniref:DUF4244 domain-containing protein n=1 Tax=Kineococcus vitellinus TaxID=2696565 RepID=UPI00196B8DC3